MLQSLRTKIKLLGIVFVILVLLLVIAALRGGGNSYTFRTSSQTVIKELRTLNRLETAAFTIEKVIDAGTSGNKLQEVLFGDRILLIAHGEVIAGFDLSKMANDSVKISGGTLRVTLPSPEILVTRIDNEQTRVYDRKLGLLTRGEKDLEAKARAEAERIIRDAAIKGNILDEARKNARNQLTSLFRTMGFTTVIIDIP